MSFTKLLATLGLLFSNESAAAPAEQPSRAPMQLKVPFGCGLSFEISQAHNVGSHLHNDTWAWDFRMPEGVPITAAREGVVRMARGDSTVGGCDAKYAKYANYVVIDHGDGTEAQYLHFSSVTVEAGQKVRTGELLGYSGKTGWACGSHLHFKVAERVHNGWNNPSIPAHFEGYGDPEIRTVLHAPSCAGGSNEVIHADVSNDAPAADVAEVEAEGTTGTTLDVRPASLQDRRPSRNELNSIVAPDLNQASGTNEGAPMGMVPGSRSDYTGTAARVR